MSNSVLRLKLRRTESKQWWSRSSKLCIPFEGSIWAPHQEC